MLMSVSEWSDRYSPSVDNFSERDNNDETLLSKRGHYINHDGHQQKHFSFVLYFSAHGHTEL